MPTFKTPTALNSFTSSVNSPTANSATGAGLGGTPSSSTGIAPNTFAPPGGNAPYQAPNTSGLPAGYSTPAIATTIPGYNPNANYNAGVQIPSVRQPGTVVGSNSSRTVTTPTGTSAVIGSNGNVSSITPGNQFSINTQNPVPSDAINANNTSGSLNSAWQQYQDIYNASVNAQGYSPAYQAAQSGLYQTQAQAAALGVAGAATANQAFGSNQANNGAGLNYGSLGGATTDFVGGTIGEQQSNIAMQQAANTQQQTQASINLNTQQLARTGQIAQTGQALQYSPVAQAEQAAAKNYQALQAAYPSANLPNLDPSQDPQAQYQIAQQTVANSPAYQSQFQVQVSLPGGGQEFVNKNQIVSDASGRSVIIDSASAANAQGLQSSIQSNQQALAPIQAALTTAQSNFSLLQQVMKQNNINDTSSPLANQLQQKVEQGATGAYAPYNALVTSLQATYSLIIARGGTVDDQTRTLAAQLFNGSLNFSQLSQLNNTLTADANNVVQGYQSEIATNTKQLQDIYSTGKPFTAAGAGTAQTSSSPFEPTSFYGSPTQ